MNNVAAISIFLFGSLASVSTASAGAELSSPAFVQQANAGGAGFASIDTAAIMKPVMDLVVSSAPVNTTSTTGNLSFVYQSGDFNTASIEQSGSRNVGLIQQIGYMNAASITQSGMGHQAFIAQEGRNNVAIIRQR
ncbi:MULTISPECIES: hypothetical protein [Shinella]|uniref:Minor curlin subunit n=1 Tax=Shinella sedimenti TaxID=2919913 RepID=A0ABT0CTS7_9HYPH|nr:MULTISPECIES: hypothetical protein [Shinella]MCJ8152012.1 hypothetical protein [Shinella sedimenti]